MTYLFFSDKDPLEVLTLSVDFSTVPLNGGETISSAEWTIIRENGTEDTAGMLSGAVDISAAPVIRQKVQGGTDGGGYLHRVKVITNQRTLVQGVRQNVKVGA